jgi:hypothetical protein
LKILATLWLFCGRLLRRLTGPLAGDVYEVRGWGQIIVSEARAQSVRVIPMRLHSGGPEGKRFWMAPTEFFPSNYQGRYNQLLYKE